MDHLGRCHQRKRPPKQPMNRLHDKSDEFADHLTNLIRGCISNTPEFRVEELLLFLDREQLFTNWLPGWNRIVEQSLTDWNLRQTRATVRRHPEAAVDQLQHMGYKITPPPTSTRTQHLEMRDHESRYCG